MVTVPLTYEAFLADLARPGEKDFARHIRRQDGTKFWKEFTDENFWGNVYGKAAGVMCDVCDKVAAQGVTVKKDATLSDFTALLQRFSVVTLVAHWRFILFEREDLIDVGALWHALRAPETDLQAAVQDAVSRHNADLLRKELVHGEQEAFATVLWEILNKIVAKAHAFYSNPNETSQQAIYSLSSLDRLTRPALEAAFPGLLRPARAVEFADGLHTVAEVVTAVPTGFADTLDLTLCNSVILGAAIKQRHRPCEIPMNRFSKELDIGLIRYRIAIELLAHRPAPYVEALLEAEELLIQAVQDRLRDEQRRRAP